MEWPEYMTEEEEAEFWETASLADYWDLTEPVDEQEITPAES